MKRLLILFLPLFLILSSFHPNYETESSYVLRISPYFNEQPVVLNRYLNDDSLIFTRIKYYISKVEFRDVDQMKFGYKEVSQPKLYDPEEKMFPEFGMDFGPTFQPDSLYLTFGIDSLDQKMASMRGDLDPIHGMYWTWHSGFVHLKVEGEIKGKSFEYHLGGYNEKQAAFEKVGFKMDANKREYRLHLNLEPLISYVDTNNMIMSAGPETQKLMKRLADSFTLE